MSRETDRRERRERWEQQYLSSGNKENEGDVSQMSSRRGVEEMPKPPEQK